MSAVQKVRRAIQNRVPFDELKRKFDDAIRIYEKYDNPYGHPIHYAARDGWPEMLTVLVEKLGCDVNLTNNEGLTPFEIALAFCSLSACKRLYNLGAQIPTTVSSETTKTIIDSGCTDMLYFVIYHQIIKLSDIKKYIMEDFGRLPLGMKEIAIALGCNINDLNNWRHMTQLMIYVRYYSDLEVIKFMLAAGADISMYDAQGDSVFDHLNFNYNFVLFSQRTPKEKVLQLLSEGVSKEYQLFFDQRIKNV